MIRQATYSIQMLEFLPQNVTDAIRHLNIQKLYEIRIRANKPITVNYEGRYCYLSADGLTDIAEKSIRCDSEDVADCVFKEGKFSVYSVEEQIKRGYITAEGGERIGLAGEYVYDKGQPLAIRNVTSLCIRVPHEVIGCGHAIYQSCMRDELKSLLICSPPGLGKTTILRDLARILCKTTQKNTLICDERGEISAGEVGISCDVLKFASKSVAFEAGIRAMRPEIIVTDELSIEDCIAIKKAIAAGIHVIASAHFSAMENVSDAFLGVFDRYIILDNEKIGKIQGIYDKNGRELIAND